MMFRRFKNILRRFSGETTGSISVEFMLILPLLFWWYAASFIFYDAFSTHSKSVKVSYMISDILSRQTEIDNAYLDGLETFVKYMTRVDGVWVRITSVQYSDVNGYEVVWSYSTGTEAALVTSVLYSHQVVEDFLPIMASGETILLAETYVDYDPAYDVGFLARTWSNVIVTRPRFAPQVHNTDF